MQDLYHAIIEEYESGKSIAAIAAKLRTTKVRVQRVLITAGKWTSKRTKQIAELRASGMSVPEIAEVLGIDEKTVQTYLPYSRGEETGYGMEETGSSVSSKEYRDRQKNAAEKMAERTRRNDDMNLIEFPIKPDPELPAAPAEDPVISGCSENRIYRLKFELVPAFSRYDRTTLPAHSREKEPLFTDAEDLSDFKKYAKAENGIIREVLVPGTMNLHAMHYMIQQLFGWQNSHLHSFTLPREDLKLVTGNRVKGWADLCGALFRFPDNDQGADSCWDDDYTAGKSVKTWIRKKYTRNRPSLALGDNWYYNRTLVRDFRSGCKCGRIRIQGNPDVKRKEIRGSTSLVHLPYVFEEQADELMEGLTVQELFIRKDTDREDIRSWRQRQENELLLTTCELEEEDPAYLAEIEDTFRELMKWRKSLAVLDHYLYADPEQIRNQTGEEPEVVEYYHRKLIRQLERVFSAASWKPQLTPYFDTIFYSYDYGDDWTVKITCEEIFSRSASAGSKETDPESNALTIRRYITDDMTSADDAWNALLTDVENKNRPLCVSMDGLNVPDDVGGVYGYLNFLRTIHGNDPDEAEEMKQWGRSLGWTGRMSRPENVL